MAKKKYTFSKNGPGTMRTIAPDKQRYRTDRIDIDVQRDGTVLVTQMTRYPSQRRDIPHTWTTYSPDVGFDIHMAIEWCKDHGFVVATWPECSNGGIIGARAWRGEKKWEIRTGWEINKLRGELEREALLWADNALDRKKYKLQKPRLTMYDLAGMDLAFVG